MRRPKSSLYDALGSKVMELENAGPTPLMQAGFKFPEPFKVKADDGITDLYGVMYKPFDFDPTKKYPIIEYVYPGSADRERDQDVHPAPATDRRWRTSGSS